MTRHRRPATVLAAALLASLVTLGGCTRSNDATTTQLQSMEVNGAPLIPRPASLQLGEGRYTVNNATDNVFTSCYKVGYLCS